LHTLATRRCRPRTKESDLLSMAAINEMLYELDGWMPNDEGSRIQRSFHFKDFYQTMAFINAVAWVAQQQDHHPDMQVSYNHCQIHYTTHSIGGVTENDLICAAKINSLLDSNATA